MREAEVKRIALFFFFVTLDEATTISMATQAYAHFDRRAKNPPPPLHPQGVDWNSTCLVWATHDVWQKYRNKFKRGRPQLNRVGGWGIGAGLDMGPWKEFQKNASEEELLCLVWSLLLNLKENEIAAGLSVNTGTVRYRVGRGLKRLGSYDTRGGQGSHLGVVK